ncbi:MAG: threonylcarbamoyl-AMP synthase [Bacteroidetes bacterium]|nr:threonylcarbamoyl-AMP synthase [Bacteroidota bacterium]
MIGTDIKRAKALLQNNQLVGIPTETVYGLAGNAFSKEAVVEIFRVKNRPAFDPLIIHTSSFERINEFVHSIPEQAQELAKHFMPGSLTLLLPKKDILPELVTSGSSLVAVRIPAHPMTLSLLSQLDFPVAAPSANPFGYISPTSAEHVEQQLGDRIPYVLDGGICKVGIESTIVGFEKDEPVIFRKGGIAIEKIESLIGEVRIKPHSSSNPKAPGMLKSHYAPHIPVLIGDIEQLLTQLEPQKTGILSFRKSFSLVPSKQQIILSNKGDLSEAARNLFAGMRQLDKMDIEIILAELLPEEGLGRAINDRLKRAAAR